jgi:ABC-2 type transport system permease protein
MGDNSMRVFKKHTFIEYIILYCRFLRMIALSRMQYKLDTFLLSLAVLVRESVTVVTLYLILLRFSQIKGWDIGQLLFLYSFVFLTYSLCVLIFTGVRDFEHTVHQGEFDGYLTKPIHPLFQVIARKSDIMATFGHGGLGLIMFIYSYQRMGIPFTLYNLLILLGVIMGGILIQGALLLIPAALTFWTTKSSEIQNLMFYQMRSFIAYPLSIYPKFIQYLLTYVIPLAFVNYYPAQYFFESKGAGHTIYLTPLIGIAIFAAAVILWMYGVRHYKSSGH